MRKYVRRGEEVEDTLEYRVQKKFIFYFFTIEHSLHDELK